MKKITLLLAFMALGASAQNFPTPYCEIEDYFDVEEITSVDFNGTSITNDDLTSVLLDFTTTVVNVAPGQNYTLTVQGNTYGDYENEYVAFIDWNQNDILDDEGEVFYIGLIYDSDGADAENATTEITVPEDAVPGNTRIRIIKTYTDALFGFTLITDPCNILVEFEEFGPDTSYGQALDFTLNITTLGIDTLDKKALTTYPNPVKDFLNVKYSSKINDVKVYNLLGQEVFSKEIGQSDFQVNLSNLATGSYVVKLFAEEGQHSFKLLKD
ncbi:hypothetical protein J2X31_002734 [Flavobacterium arsenatis]|uniref:Secretion system C-terminal sorting domain-containing protein n=1 Tax=Flavobacterium arsenatis TaxID=1484332 RepID=A0ABU1TS55_9FLAO|nr:T9SS type A sorting domain-containing protein [Flavobacterium arsenatis]MDR6968708.1 hypothetical protein [Flavobacterium arsenatis]